MDHPGWNKTEVSRSGNHAHGVWWDRHARPLRSLYLVAACDWTARVVRPRQTREPAPQPGHRVTHKPRHQHKVLMKHKQPMKPKKRSPEKRAHKKHAHKKHAHKRHA